MTTMLSNRPYLLRAFYEWIVDSECTPILVIDTTVPGCKLPKEHQDSREVVFNISPLAVRDLKIEHTRLEFRASFSGVIHIISMPIRAVLSIYAEENGDGIFFDEEDNLVSEASPDYFPQSQNQAQEQIVDSDSKPAAKGKPHLRLVTKEQPNSDS